MDFGPMIEENLFSIMAAAASFISAWAVFRTKIVYLEREMADTKRKLENNGKRNGAILERLASVEAKIDMLLKK